MLESGEAGVAGVTVTLSEMNPVTGQPSTETTTTNASGVYTFPGAVAETGTIAIVVPANTAADTPTSVNVSIPLTGLANQNFGLTMASIGGTIFADGNDDGLQGASDTGIPNVVLLLTGMDTSGNSVSLSTITGADGSYLFTNLNPGTYTVTKVPPSGYLDGIETVGSTGGTAGTDSLGGITVATGQPSTGNNFAELLPASLAGTVFVDANNNGVKDSGEVGVLGVTVTLTGFDDLGNPVDLTTTTSASGDYNFANLRPSNSAGYTITETRPAGYLDGIDSVGSQGGTLGDRTITGIVLDAGIAGANNNFGELAPGTVGGIVYIDANDNGADDSGEGGVAGVVLTLTGVDDLGNPVSLTTTTAANGTYSFTGLRPSGTGGYTVTETPPAGYLPGLGSSDTASTGVINDVMLEPGGTSSVSFPELLPASLSGYVYQDLNDGGAKGSNEPGIAGVTVTLTGYNDLQQPVLLTTTTNANGLYSFTNLRPSLSQMTEAGLPVGYTITETQPTAFLEGKDAIGTPGGVTGDDVFSEIPLVAGFNGINNDFGELPPASLSGFAYVDSNDDGTKQAGEAGIAGVVITLTGVDDQGNAVSLTTTTAADGSYAFNDLRPSGTGGYTLSETPPANDLQGKDTIGSEGGVTTIDQFSGLVLTAGTAGVNNNFGELLPASLSGYVYLDANDDGVKQAGEPGLSGVTITLTGVDDLGHLVDVSTTTAADGSYTFNALRPSSAGGYTLTETPPVGYFNGKDDPGALGGTVGTDILSGIVLTSGVSGPNNDFAELGPSSLAGFVYLDANKDGVKDSGDTGLSGVTVTLTGTADNGMSLKTFTTTGADGSYSFSGLLPGTYSVSDVPPTDYVESVTVAGSSGGQVKGNVVSSVTLGVGVAATAYNFAETGVYVSGTVYDDTNGDGKLETGEPGVAGVTITLVGSNGQTVATTTTATDGSYSFTNLPTVSYTIVETPPVGDLTTSPTSIAICCCSWTTGLANQNFGVQVGGAISGFVYVDANNDGVKESTETGIGGATIELVGTTTLGQAVQLSTTTAANGSYRFNGLLTGTYSLVGSPVASYADGQDAPGSASGVAQSDDTIGQIVLGSNVVATNYDFGKIGSSLSGTVTLDGTPAPGATVTVSQGGTVIGTTTTGPNGTYTLTGVPTGTTTINATLAVPVGPPASETIQVGVTAGAPTTGNVNLVGLDTASISGHVYDDVNASGVLTATDPGLAGVLITLGGSDLAGNVIYRQILTGPDGSYSFTNLPAGHYAVLEATLPYVLDGAVTPGSLGGTVTDHLINDIALGVGAQGVNNNFGQVAPSAITGTVYLDANKNGVFDNEFGIANTTVTLDGYDFLGHRVTESTVSAANGTYVFADLAPGEYQVTVDRVTQYFNAGASNPGTAGGSVHGPTISLIPLAAATIDANYNFGQQIRAGCKLSVPSVMALVDYGPHPNGVPASLLKGVNFASGGPVSYYLPTLAAEHALVNTRETVNVVTSHTHEKAESIAEVPVVQQGKVHPTASLKRRTVKMKPRN